MDPTFIVSPNTYSVRIYEKHPDNYTGIFNVEICGDVGIVKGINARGFYEFWSGPGRLKKLFETMKVASLQGTMRPAHAVLVGRGLEAVATVEVARKLTAYGRKMVWVVIKLKEPA